MHDTNIRRSDQCHKKPADGTHPACIIFALIMRAGCVPSEFRYSYIVSVPKLKDC